MKSSNKILTLVIGLLLVSNIVLVYFLVNGSGRNHLNATAPIRLK